jgi:DnaJ-class molecular chaperone
MVKTTMKLKISYQKHPITEQADKKCLSCSGSGYYDDANPRTGKAYKCDACGGTGYEHPELCEDRSRSW